MTLRQTYQALPECFYQPATPELASQPELCLFNHALADKIGLNQSQTMAWMCGCELPVHPIAQAYAGHQFGQLSMLGDGRAVLLGDIETHAGVVDVQLKGSGRTPYSRQGDGKANLAPMLREYLISEAMHALGVPTTRSLAVLKTGEAVRRRAHRQGAVLARVASSHLRIGTFVYASMVGDLSAHRALLDFALRRHYPDLLSVDNPALALLDVVIDKQALLVAHWQRVGFVHGVLNTDNVTISGETIDYGPCAFMDAYSPATVFSSIDHQGRYAFGNQPPITQWNLARFAESLLPLIDENEDRAIALATDSLDRFESAYFHYWHAMLTAKVGLPIEQAAFAEAFLDLLAERQQDYTNSFIMLTQLAMAPASQRKIHEVFPNDEGLQGWLSAWLSLISEESVTRMQTHNPTLIPRNHHVEQVLSIAESDGIERFQALHQALLTPYDWQNMHKEYQSPASSEWNAHYQTFCGT